MTEAASDPDRAAAAPESPCIEICTIGADGYCEGCLRTLDEIARWGTMGPGAQRLVLDRLAARRDRRRSNDTGGGA